MADYRDRLYEQYFQNQAGRRMAGEMQTHLKDQWRQLSAEVLPHLPKEPRSVILDMGCGFGQLLMLLKEKGYTDTRGIDISLEQVTKAKELGLVNVIAADAFPFLASNRNTFDAIMGIDIIEHFSPNELIKLLDNIRHALKPGGMAIFRTPNMDAPFASTYAFGDFTHQSFLNYSSANQLFHAAGFSQVEVLPSYINVGGVKEIFRKLVWKVVTLRSKLALFATGKSTRDVLLTPNLIIKVKK